MSRDRIHNAIVIDLTSSSSDEAEQPQPWPVIPSTSRQTPSPTALSLWNAVPARRARVLSTPTPTEPSSPSATEQTQSSAQSSSSTASTELVTEPSSTNSDVDSDIECLGPAANDTSNNTLADLDSLTGHFYKNFMTDQDYVSYKILWEVPTYKVRNEPRFNRPIPIAVEMLWEPNFPEEREVNASISTQEDMQRIVKKTYIIKIAFGDRSKKRLRILRHYVRSNKVYSNRAMKNVHLFVDGEFRQANHLHYKIDDMYMKKPARETLCWPTKFVNLVPELHPGIEDFFEDGTEALIMTMIDDFEANWQERYLFDRSIKAEVGPNYWN